MSSSSDQEIDKTSPTDNQQVLPQGPLLSKLRQRLNSATTVDLGLKERIKHLDGKHYLQVDEKTGFLTPLSLGVATSLDGSKTFQYQKSTDTWKYSLQQQAELNEHLKSSRNKGVFGDSDYHQIATESDRYAYIDPVDNKAYQLHYNNGTKSYFYVNSSGEWKIFPKSQIEQSLGGELDKSRFNTRHSFRTPYYQANPNLFREYEEQADQKIGFQIDLLSQITPNPHLQHHIITHQPYIMSPNQDNQNVQSTTTQPPNPLSSLTLPQSSSLIASLQALSHLSGFNAIARELPVTNYHTKWYMKKTDMDSASSNLLNTSLRGLSVIASIRKGHEAQQHQLIQQPLLHDVVIPKIPLNLLQTIQRSLPVLAKKKKNDQTGQDGTDLQDFADFQPKWILNALLKHHNYAAGVIFNTPLSQAVANGQYDDIYAARGRIKEDTPDFNISLHLKAHTRCDCGEQSADYSMNSKQLFVTTPKQLSEVNGDLLSLLHTELTKEVDPVFMDMRPLPCNHHKGIHRSKFKQYITQSQLSNPDAKHFGIMIPRLSYHPGLRQDVHFPGSVFVPFLFPLRRRSKPKKNSTNMDVYFLQSFIVYEGENAEKGQYKAYGNISSTGSPSWWYEYTNNSTTKVPIDYVINQSRSMYCGFYTKTPSKDFILNHYHRKVLPQLHKQSSRVNADDMRRF